MEPAYHHLQLVALNKCEKNYQHGDVIAFYCDGLTSTLVKRVVAVPGDTAQIVDGTLMINGQTSQVYSETGVISYSGLLENPVTLDSGQYLVLGDNLPESKDSRYQEVGIVSKEKIWGKVCS